MSFSIGFDIGGTKIAGAVYDEQGVEIALVVRPTPAVYSDLVDMCASIIGQLDREVGRVDSVGIGIPGIMDFETGYVRLAANLPCLSGTFFQKDIEKILMRSVRVANDANCAALSEAVNGAGTGHKTVFGLIMGTGVGGGFIIDGRIVEGVNGLAGGWGHLPLPFREASDGTLVECGCGQRGCIDKTISGSGLARLYEFMTGKQSDAAQIAALARQGDVESLHVLDGFYETVAKAMTTVIHCFDPHIIVVSGGLSDLPNLYEEVPKRWGRYALCKNPKTKFVQAKHGAMSGLRGAAWVGRKL